MRPCSPPLTALWRRLFLSSASKTKVVISEHNRYSSHVLVKRGWQRDSTMTVLRGTQNTASTAYLLHGFFHLVAPRLRAIPPLKRMVATSTTTKSTSRHVMCGTTQKQTLANKEKRMRTNDGNQLQPNHCNYWSTDIPRPVHFTRNVPMEALPLPRSSRVL